DEGLRPSRGSSPWLSGLTNGTSRRTRCRGPRPVLTGIRNDVSDLFGRWAAKRNSSSKHYPRCGTRGHFQTREEPNRSKRRGTMKHSEKVAPVAAVISAVLSVTCCLPLGIPVAIGLAGFGVLMAQLRPWFMALSLALLAVGLVQLYRRRACQRHNL